MTAWIYSGAATALVLASGLVHGLWTDRWARSDETNQAREALATVPMTVGDWVGKDVEKPSQPGPGVTGSMQRIYTNRRTNVSVSIAIVNGRPGPVGTHTPEVCYGASGYLVGEKKAVELDVAGQGPKFWTSDAVRTKVTEKTAIRLYWGWNAGGGWVASKDARHEFPRYAHPVLHKLYVLRDLNGQAVAADKEEPCESFLKLFVPAMQSTLFAG
ncbi:MAG: exosortase-associated EpsI family protein [Gemmataceae bacterium]